jgi:hypothetical protein
LRTLPSVFWPLLVAFAARADQVILKNGDRLTGKIVTGDGKTLLLKSEFAGDVTIQWDAITDTESSDNINITLNRQRPRCGPPRRPEFPFSPLRVCIHRFPELTSFSILIFAASSAAASVTI